MGSSIEINNLTKVFLKNVPPVLDKIQATFPTGKIVGIVGPDGAGKTTLMRLMAALLLPTEGSIKVAGFDTVKESSQVSNSIGYMPQKFGLYEDLTVMQNLNLYADLKDLRKEEKKTAFDSLLSFTGLAPFTSRLSGALSGGMKQKLGLACALITKPKVLLLDEPSVGVDPISRNELWKMTLQLLAEDTTIIWSTAYLEEAQRCHHVLLLNNGKMLFYGTPQEFKNQTQATTFEEAFVSRLGGYQEKPSPLAEARPLIEDQEKSVITCSQLTRKFKEFIAVDHIDCQVNRGEIFGLIGPNGAGKSTTFRMLCGLLPPTSGTTSILGMSLEQAPSTIRARIGYMAQKFSLYGNLTVMQNLDFFAGIYNLQEQQKTDAIKLMVEIFDLKKYAHTLADTLPLGFKQRLSLACATMHKPDIIFLDEPTSGVDPITRREFWGHIKALVKKKVTIMITTHYMDEAENCDQIALIFAGKIVKQGSPAELKACTDTSTLEDAFIQLIQGAGSCR